MSYEAGSKECRHLIEAKESLLSTLDALSNIPVSYTHLTLPTNDRV